MTAAVGVVLLLVSLDLGSALLLLAGATVVGVAWRSWFTYVLASADGVCNVGLLRTQRLRWEDIVGFDVARPGALWGGFCVRALLRDDTEHDLLSLRAYSRVASLTDYGELYRQAWALESRRPERGTA